MTALAAHQIIAIILNGPSLAARQQMSRRVSNQVVVGLQDHLHLHHRPLLQCRRQHRHRPLLQVGAIVMHRTIAIMLRGPCHAHVPPTRGHVSNRVVAGLLAQVRARLLLRLRHRLPHRHHHLPQVLSPTQEEFWELTLQIGHSTTRNLIRTLPQMLLPLQDEPITSTLDSFTFVHQRELHQCLTGLQHRMVPAPTRRSSS